MTKKKAAVAATNPKTEAAATTNLIPELCNIQVQGATIDRLSRQLKSDTSYPLETIMQMILVQHEYTQEVNCIEKLSEVAMEEAMDAFMEDWTQIDPQFAQEEESK